ncbi:hypothetical protein FOMPIDRAFT_88811 [Fomitopsis schrenkii]|uniref:Uncharacterized protein n=1 Tax=Fomitopsis schrenkii TaxID=2126942 RepID=S8FV92_FOMSC|nr:hypothetical protein FOMPIDRAFT_88811 [Fomitopsis schrenkii]
MSANTVLLRAVLDHVEEIEHLCGELPPLSPRSRQSVASIHNRPFSLQSSLGETSPTTTMTANIITMIYVSMAAPPPVPRSDATACQRAPASTSSPRQQAPASLFDNDDGEDDKEKSVTGRNASTATAAVAARSSRVLAHTGSDPCPLADIVQAALGTHQHAKAKAADLEDLALARLLCGPPSAASLHDWVSGGNWLGGNHTTSTTSVISSTFSNGIAGITECLTARHKASAMPSYCSPLTPSKALTASMLGETANYTLVFVLSQIDHLKFAVDWQFRGRMPGGKKRATQFFQTLFMQDPNIAPHFVGLSSTAMQAKICVSSAASKSPPTSSSFWTTTLPLPLHVPPYPTCLLAPCPPFSHSS